MTASRFPITNPQPEPIARTLERLEDDRAGLAAALDRWARTHPHSSVTPPRRITLPKGAGTLWARYGGHWNPDTGTHHPRIYATTDTNDRPEQGPDLEPDPVLYRGARYRATVYVNRGTLDTPTQGWHLDPTLHASKVDPPWSEPSHAGRARILEVILDALDRADEVTAAPVWIAAGLLADATSDHWRAKRDRDEARATLDTAEQTLALAGDRLVSAGLHLAGLAAV